MIEAPVAVRVVDQGNVLHLAVLRALLELDAEFLEAVALGLHVVNRDSNVTEASDIRRASSARVFGVCAIKATGGAGLNSPATRLLDSVGVALKLGALSVPHCR